MAVGLFAGHLARLRCLAVCCCWPGFAALLDVNGLIALAWPVSGILVGWPVAAAGIAAWSAASWLAACIAIAVHDGFMR
jgi:hypothetical protein